MGISDRVEEELSRLWDSGQDWILIFDNLLKHPGGKASKGCKCDMCEMQKLQHNHNSTTHHNTSAATLPHIGNSVLQQNSTGNLEKSRSGATSPQTSEISGNLTLPYFAVSTLPCKAELLQLNQTQFPSLGIFVNKKVGNLIN